jgi:hypothetical protein
VSAFSPWNGPQFKHLQTPSVVTKARRRTDKAEALSAAYAACDRRDKSTCRVTGRTLKAGAPDARVRREHHHLVERSRDKGLIAEPSNIITVAAEVHALITAGMIVVEGTNAGASHSVRPSRCLVSLAWVCSSYAACVCS